MGKNADWIVEYAPWILVALGVLLIALDGPLPFMDIFGVALIAYGRGLGTVYHIADLAIAFESYYDTDPSVIDDRVGVGTKPTTPVRLGAPHGSRSSRTKSLYGLGAWCNIHKRIDNCRYVRSPR